MRADRKKLEELNLIDLLAKARSFSPATEKAVKIALALPWKHVRLNACSAHYVG